MSLDCVDMSRYKIRNYRRILNTCDIASRYVWSFAIRNKEPQTIINCLEQVLQDMPEGCPKLWVSDDGGEFRNAETKAWCQERGIKQSFTKSYSPQGNGLIETINQQVRRTIYDLMVQSDDVDWVKYVPRAAQLWNSSKHAGAKYYPEFIFLSSSEDVEEERAQVLQSIEDRASEAAGD